MYMIRIRCSPAGPGTGAIPSRLPVFSLFTVFVGTGAGVAFFAALAGPGVGPAARLPACCFCGALAEGAGASAGTMTVTAGLLGLYPEPNPRIGMFLCAL